MSEEIKTSDKPENKFKYTSHEEAEKGYKELESLLGKKDALLKSEQEAKQKEINELANQYKAPDSYILPDGITISESIKNNMDGVAKKAGLTQKQYTEMVKSLSESEIQSQSARQKKIDEVKRSIESYDDKRSKLEVFLKQKHGENIAKIVSQNLDDKDFFNTMWTERERFVSTGATIGGTVVAEKSITQEELIKAREESNKAPHRIDLRDKYLEMIEQYAKDNPKFKKLVSN